MNQNKTAWSKRTRWRYLTTWEQLVWAVQWIACGSPELLLSCSRTRSDRQQAPTQFTADLKTTAFSCFSTITIFIISSFFWLCCPEPWPGHLSHAAVMNEPQKRQLAGSQFFLHGGTRNCHCDDNTMRRPCSEQLLHGDTWVEAVFMFMCPCVWRQWWLTSVVTDWHFFPPQHSSITCRIKVGQSALLCLRNGGSVDWVG